MSRSPMDAHKDFVVQADGAIPDGTVCPWCMQPRPGEDFYIYKVIDEKTRWERRVRTTTTRCLNCRKKYGKWA